MKSLLIMAICALAFMLVLQFYIVPQVDGAQGRTPIQRQAYNLVREGK